MSPILRRTFRPTLGQPALPIVMPRVRLGWRLGWILALGLAGAPLARAATDTLADTGTGTAAPTATATSDSLQREITQQFKRGDTTAALQRLDQALAARPGDAQLRFLKGVLLSESGRGGEAAALFERMTYDFPDLPEPYNNLAVLRAAEGALDTARDLLEAAVRLAPGYRTAHQNLGDVFVRLAARSYQRATRGAPVDPPLQRKLALAEELLALH